MRVQLGVFFNLKISSSLRKRTDIPAIVLAKSFEFALTIDEVKILDLFNPRWTLKIGEVEITKVEQGTELWERGVVDYWLVETKTEFWVRNHRYILKRTMRWYLSEHAMSGGTYELELNDGHSGKRIL
ncbi:MAG: hypothetical protein ACTSQ8_23535 [Candidatus Helarchaeota archaeon]